MLADLAARTGRVVQVGTQSRSNPAIRRAADWVRSGRLGKVELAYGTCYKRRKSIGRAAAPTAPPATVDYDLWCGPARRLPVARRQLHYDWHWVWEYGNGDLGNQGVHQIDIARWGLGDPGLPTAVTAVGGRFGYTDDGQTPNTLLAAVEYPAADLLFEVRGLDTGPYKSADVGVIWFGDGGYVVCPSYSDRAVVYDRDGGKVAEFRDGSDDNHFDDFAAAVRAGDPAEVSAPLEQGHQSAAVCHLANVSYRLGAERPLAGAAGFAAGPRADALGRMLAHLAANRVDPAAAVGRVGPRLALDPAAERVTAVADGGDVARANALLARGEYRRGFELAGPG